MPNRLPPIPLPFTKLRTVVHQGRTVARYVDDADQLLHVLGTSPVRALDHFAREWTEMLPDQKTTLARHALAPWWLAADVAKNACALSMRRLTAILDKNLEMFRGLIRVATFVDEETGELRSALTLKGAKGVNLFLVLVSKEAQTIRGLYRGCKFVQRIAPVLRAVEEPATISALVSAIDSGCSMRLAVLDGAERCAERIAAQAAA